MRTPPGSPSGEPARAGASRSSPGHGRPRVPVGRARRDSPATAPAEQSPSQPQPQPCLLGGRFSAPANLSQLIPLTLRQPQGSALVPVSERGRARADRASPGHASPGRVSPVRCIRPGCKSPGNACQGSRCFWTGLPSLFRKPLGLSAAASRRGHGQGGRQRAWHIPVKGVGIIHLSFSKREGGAGWNPRALVMGQAGTHLAVGCGWQGLAASLGVDVLRCRGGLLGLWCEKRFHPRLGCTCVTPSPNATGVGLDAEGFEL